jgi:hypothetical protein
VTAYRPSHKKVREMLKTSTLQAEYLRGLETKADFLIAGAPCCSPRSVEVSGRAFRTDPWAASEIAIPPGPATPSRRAATSIHCAS